MPILLHVVRSVSASAARRARRLSDFLCNLRSAGGETFGKEKLKVGEGGAPFFGSHGSGLFPLQSEKEHLEGGLVRRKLNARIEHLSELGIQGLDGIGSV